MTFVRHASMARTLDAIDEALFIESKIPRPAADEAARWIAARQGLPGSYAGMFGPCPADLGGIRLFTGERVATRAGIAHVLGEDACRVLRRLRVKAKPVVAALERAEAGMRARLHEYVAPDSGEYCCAACSVVMWRNLAAGGLDAAEARLADGMRRLQERRRPGGTWQRYPFYYTLLALTEIGGATARPALQHAAPRCERLLKMKVRRTPFAWRRRAILERALAGAG